MLSFCNSDAFIHKSDLHVTTVSVGLAVTFEVILSNNGLRVPYKTLHAVVQTLAVRLNSNTSTQDHALISRN